MLPQETFLLDIFITDKRKGYRFTPTRCSLLSRLTLVTLFLVLKLDNSLDVQFVRDSCFDLPCSSTVQVYSKKSYNNSKGEYLVEIAQRR